ncbi:uncharacterized protein SPPG_06697 [Spizellomyces punctatus DAOM BR117]|uniref:PUM-HD domain-containing protein n=1 Tax=Spizellomyces punctatus (strain DAOM BR117) TaxID=645134 RepID=A0A0L0HC08_SPIPD|nr:uncharacterized protein SPPG_06697 [Spizellomyces punctatus DAOM BR117]KNC98303.1 hypothetical protein SPPG_06697 [Spizellomyces punctatus DAOM BR117]|eukprot:XP_016606343.1 hypothetical protein SPPG_06697 [Spizellomyces punctatus DAOM BR117]
MQKRKNRQDTSSKETRKSKPLKQTTVVIPSEPRDDSERSSEGSDQEEWWEDAEGRSQNGDDMIDDEEENDGIPDSPASKRPKLDPEAEEKQRKNRAEQKSLLLERKAQKPNATLIQQAKRIWEKLRQKKLDEGEREKQMEELMALIKGKVPDIIFKHDASRIVQCALKYGNRAQRDAIAAELKGHYAAVSQSSYGRFIISKILNYCSAEYRSHVIKDFHGKIRKLIRHREAAVVLEEAYSQFANSQQRSSLLEEFYGPEFALFKNGGGRNIETLIAENPHKRAGIVKHLREVLNSVLEKGFTNISHLSIVHRAILEYLTYAEEKNIADMVELLKDHLVSILHTREGARVAQRCILYAGPKDRKHIVKTFKGYIGKVAREQYGHTVLFTIFDAVDDTVLIEKAIIGELVTDGLGPGEAFGDLLRDRVGSKVALYLLCGRNRKLQPAFVIDELEALDPIRARTSKKDDKVRREQLLKAFSPPLIQTVEQRCAELIRDGDGSIVLMETVIRAEGDKQSLIEAIASLAEGRDGASGLVDTESGPVNVIKKMKADAVLAKQQEEGIDLSQHVLIHRKATSVLKNLVAPRKKVPNGEDEYKGSLVFATALAKRVAPNVAYWLRHCAEDPKRTSGTAFVFVALVESGGTEAQRLVIDAVHSEAGLIEELEQKVQANLAKVSSSQEDEDVAGRRKRKTGKPSTEGQGGSKTGMEILLLKLREMES